MISGSVTLAQKKSYSVFQKKRLQDILKTVDTYKHIFQIAGTIIQGIYQIDKPKKERKQAIQTF